MTDTAHPPKKRKGRSPSYPAIDLETAIRRVRQLWDEERQHPVPVDTILKHWGYRSLNGPASLTLAALKKFGLVEDEGSGAARAARVSNLAVDIMENPDPRERREAIQRAALSPKVHQELWDQYGVDPPSDANLRWVLTRDRGFTETGADEFIPEYKSTISFAQLHPGDTVATQTDQGPSEDGGDEQERIPDSPAPRRRRVTEDAANVLTIPLMGGTSVVVEGEFPITEADWVQLMAVFNAMKPGLVRSSDNRDAGEPEDGSED